MARQKANAGLPVNSDPFHNSASSEWFNWNFAAAWISIPARKASENNKPSATVKDFEPPAPLLLAVAQGAQSASPVTDPRFAAGFYGASIVGGTAYAAYGAYGGYAGLTALGLKYRALGTASGAAFTAAQNANKFIVPLKHLANSAGRWAKFAQGVDPQQVNQGGAELAQCEVPSQS